MLDCHSGKDTYGKEENHLRRPLFGRWRDGEPISAGDGGKASIFPRNAVGGTV